MESPKIGQLVVKHLNSKYQSLLSIDELFPSWIKGLVLVFFTLGSWALTGQVTVAATDNDASEVPLDNGTFTITLTPPNTTGGPITVEYSLGGTAVEGLDYAALTGSVEIADTDASAAVTIAPINDARIEEDETVTIELDSESSGTYLIINSNPTVNISSEDFLTVEFTGTAFSDVEADGGDIPQITASGGITEADTFVEVTVTGGTATQIFDYTLLGPTNVFLGRIGPGNYVTPQTAAIPGFTIIDEGVVEPDETVLFSLTDITGPGTPQLGAQTTATYTILNDDSPPDPVATITATDDIATEVGANNGTFQIDLDTPNTSGGAITINYTVGGTATATDDYIALSGTVQIPNLASSAILTIDPVNDTDVEVDETVIVTLGAGTGYTVGAPNSDSVTIESEDVPTATVTAIDATATEAGTTTATFRVSLSDANITGGPLEVDYSVGGTATSGLDFTPLSGSVTIANLASTADIVLTPLDDNLIEVDETVTVTLDPDASYTVGSPNTDTITIESDDEADFTVSSVGPTNNITNESGTQRRFTVFLASQPASDVVLDIAVGDPSEGSVDKETLTFTPTNYDTSQIVTVTGLDDMVVDGDQPYTITVSVDAAQSDDAFDLLPAKFAAVINEDDDSVGINVAPTSGTTTEAGGLATFTFTLDSEPTGPVTIPINQYDPSEGSGPASVVLDASNWDEGVDLVVTGEDDLIADGNQTYILNTGDPTSTDPNYDALGAGAVAQLEITNEDDEVAQILVSPTSGTTTEGGGTAVFTFTLSTEPTDPVTIPINQYNPLEGSGPTSVVLNATNWNTGATLVVIGLDDDFVDGDVTYTLNTGDPFSDDAAYDDLGAGAIDQLEITNEDDDVAGINVTPVAGTTTEAGGTATFTFTLTAEPTAAVTIPINQYDATETSGPAAVVIPPAQWDTGVELTITGVNDAVVDGDIVDEINTGDPTSGDGAFDALVGTDVPQLNVTNEDDDTAALTIADVSGNEDDGAITVAATLDTAVVGGFTVQVSTADGSATLADGDYNAVNERLLLFSGTAGETVTFNVLPNSDGIIEPDETLSVSMSNLSGTAFSIDISDSAIITILNDDTCAAGNVAPVLNTAEPTVFCDFTSKDLDDYAIGAVPVGAVLTWSATNTALTDESTHLSSSVVASVGTYYGFFYDELNSCVSPVLEVTISSNTTPSAGTATNAAACSAVGDGPLSLDLDAQLTGQDAGVWSIVTDPSNGDVQIGSGNVVNFQGLTNGNYVFRYTTTGAVAPCANVFEDLTVTVTDCAVDCDAGNTAPQRNNAVSTIFCDAIVEPIDLNGYVVGAAPAGSVLTWSTNSDPLRTDAHRSNFVTAPGTYYGFFFDDADGTNPVDCASPLLEITIEVNSIPLITSTTEAFRCGEGTVELFATAEVGAGLNWYATAESTAVLGTGSSFVTESLTETTSFFVEAVANGCASAREEVVATINQIPSVGVPTGVVGCSRVGDTGTTVLDLTTALTGEDEGVWTITVDPSNGQVEIENGTLVDFGGLPLGNYVFTYTTTGAQPPCDDESIDVTITVVNCLLDADNDGLNDDVEEELGTDPNNPDTDGDGILDGQEVNVDGTDPLDDCDSNGGTPLGDSDCDNDGLTNSEEIDLGTDPLDPDSDEDGLTDGEEVLVEDDPNTDAVPETPSDPLDPCDPFLTEACEPEPIDIEITKEVDIANPLVNQQIQFLITASNVSMDRAIDIVVSDVISDPSLFLVGGVTSGSGEFDETTGIWTIDELLPGASATLQITGTVPLRGSFTNTATLIGSFPEDDNSENNSVEVQVTVSVSECVDSGTICNLFSPNGDGVNDNLILVSHQSFPNNTLKIFDRYGNIVYDVTGYDSSWDGTGDNGDLPRGTYYYILDLGDGTDVQKGWIQIIR